MFRWSHIDIVTLLEKKLNLGENIVDGLVVSSNSDARTWNNGKEAHRWGVAEIQKMSPPTTVGDAADMQLCVIKQGSPPVLENVAFFVTDLLTLARCAVCILNISVGME